MSKEVLEHRLRLNGITNKSFAKKYPSYSINKLKNKELTIDLDKFHSIEISERIRNRIEELRTEIKHLARLERDVRRYKYDYNHE